MRNLSAYLRSRGLRFGIYNSNSMTTCMKRAGGLYMERLDARTYADWGVDYLCATTPPLRPLPCRCRCICTAWGLW